MTTFSLEVSYAQIAVFDSTLANPFNDWTDEHVRQGFSWRPGSVSFATFDTVGRALVRVERTNPVSEEIMVADRVIVVPFTVPPHGRLEVATITDGVSLQLPPGDYELKFEHGRTEEGTMWINLGLRPVVAPVTPKVLRADTLLSPPTPLVMTAQPA